MRINHNITALNTYNKLSSNQAATSKSLEKLSSGLKINKAGDNAAGLAISEKMRGQIRGLDQASTNASDAISLINTAEGALSETHSILQRMRELAVQSSNDTNVTIDRDEIQKEMNQLTSEINRIGNTTEFNTQKLLNGGGGVQETKDFTPIAQGGAKGNISGVSTITASETGKAKMDFTLANGNVLSIEAESVGTNLNGINILFAQGGTSGVTNDGSGTVTVTADFGGAGLSATAIETLLNTSGMVSSPVSVNMTSSAGVVDNATALTTGTHAPIAAGTKTFSGGQAVETRGSFSFDVTEAFKDITDQFTLSVPTSDSPTSVATVTLDAVASGAGANEFNIGDPDALLSKEDQAASIATALAGTVAGTIYDITTSGSKIIFTEKSGSAQGEGLAKGTVSSTAQKGEYDYVYTDDEIVKAGGKFTIDGNDILVVDGSGEDDANMVAAGQAIYYNEDLSAGSTTADGQMALVANAIDTLNVNLRDKYDASVNAGTNTLKITQELGQESATAVSFKTSSQAGDGFVANFQIGANTAQSMTIEVLDMRSAALKISGTTSGGEIKANDGITKASYTVKQDVTDGTTNKGAEYALDVSTHEKATAAITVINDAIQAVSAERSKLGSYQNRLEHTINNLGTSSENLTSAESRIRDVDMAKEMMEFTKNNILSQAAQSMLAQANQQPQGVLQLLQ